MKTYNVLYKFGDVSTQVDADNESEAKQLAYDNLQNDEDIQNDSECYDIEIEVEE